MVLSLLVVDLTLERGSGGLTVRGGGGGRGGTVRMKARKICDEARLSFVDVTMNKLLSNEEQSKIEGSLCRALWGLANALLKD